MEIIIEYWKMRDILEMINNAYAKYYNPAKLLAVDEVPFRVLTNLLPSTEQTFF
jgi:hypothetical protein